MNKELVNKASNLVNAIYANMDEGDFIFDKEKLPPHSGTTTHGNFIVGIHIREELMEVEDVLASMGVTCGLTTEELDNEMKYYWTNDKFKESLTVCESNASYLVQCIMDSDLEAKCLIDFNKYKELFASLTVLKQT